MGTKHEETAIDTDENFFCYLASMAKDGTWGDNRTLSALAEQLSLEIVILSMGNSCKYVTSITPRNKPYESTIIVGYYPQHYVSLKIVN